MQEHENLKIMCQFSRMSMNMIYSNFKWKRMQVRMNSCHLHGAHIYLFVFYADHARHVERNLLTLRFI